MLPRLDNAKNIKLLLVSIGPPERGLEFSDLTGYPTNKLLADPKNVTYSALGFRKGVISTFFNPKTPLAIFDRIRKDGAKALQEILPKTKLWIPSKKDQGTQQGGALIFDGRECIWEHYDEATAAHADPQEVLDRLLQKKT